MNFSEEDVPSAAAVVGCHSGSSTSPCEHLLAESVLQRGLVLLHGVCTKFGEETILIKGNLHSSSFNFSSPPPTD